MHFARGARTVVHALCVVLCSPLPCCHLVQGVDKNKSWFSFSNFFAGESILDHHALAPHLGALVPSQSLLALLQPSHAPIQRKSLMVEGMEEYPMHQAECITANIIIITARQQAPMKCLWKIRSTIISEASSLHSRLPLPPPCYAVRNQSCQLWSTANSNALVMLCVSCLVSVSR